MIQVIVACYSAQPLAFHHEAVTGARVCFGGCFFQILEGPEAAVMLGVAVLGASDGHVVKTFILDRQFQTWTTADTVFDALPPQLAGRVLAFAQTTVQAEQPDPGRAIGLLGNLVDAEPVPAITSGRWLMSKVGGQAGKRAWLAV
ncbi:MAG: hypothetical protein ACU0GG_13215 [Paracoccaceae bacterium]